MLYAVNNRNHVYYLKTYFSFVNPAHSGRINCFGAFLSVPVVARCWLQRWGRKTPAHQLGPSKHVQTFSTDSVPLWLIMVQFYSVDTDVCWVWLLDIQCSKYGGGGGDAQHRTAHDQIKRIDIIFDLPQPYYWPLLEQLNAFCYKVTSFSNLLPGLTFLSNS